jgi:hypothetical protein
MKELIKVIKIKKKWVLNLKTKKIFIIFSLEISLVSIQEKMIKKKIILSKKSKLREKN